MAKRKLIINSNYPLKSKVYGLIMCTAHEMEAETAKCLKFYGLSKTQLDILDVLENCKGPNKTVNKIKDCLMDDSPNVSRSLNKLMARKLIIKERDEKDQRVVNIHITEEGCRIHREADMAITKADEGSKLSEDELKQLYLLLLKF